MSHNSHGNPVPTYIITALILGVITYVEFAIVEYEIAWLSSGATLFWLIALSVVKFAMVIAIFMHLKDDERTYTGFFSSGLLIALATFLIMPLLFTVRTLPQESGASAEAHGEPSHEESGVSEETRRAIETNGASRPRSEQLQAPPPADRSLTVEPPAARESEARLRAEQPTAAADGGEEATAQAQDTGQEPAGEGGAGEPVTFDRELGQAIYGRNCQSCHQAEGQGAPGMFPPLAENMPQIHAAEGGREYLIDVLLNGLQGEIEVLGETYNNFMPAWDSLSDEEIAAVLNHELTAWGNEDALGDFEPIAAEEVGARRGTDPGDLNERRSQLQAQ